MRRGSCVICVQFFFQLKESPIVGKIQVWCFSLFSPAWFKCQNTMDLKHIPFCCSIAQLLVFRLLNYDHLDVYPNILSCKRNLSSISSAKKKLSQLNLIFYSTTMKWIEWLTIVTQLPDSYGTFTSQKKLLKFSSRRRSKRRHCSSTFFLLYLFKLRSMTIIYRDKYLLEIAFEIP